MDGIMAALARGEDPETALNREVLRTAVMRAITDPHSGAVLDIRTAVYYTVTAPDDKRAAECVTGETWEQIGPVVTRACEAKGFGLEVIDGRTL